MCSICGIVDFKDKKNINEKIVRKMGKSLEHRGPDQQGVFMNRYVAFQHNRLAIIDIEKGMQPMSRTYGGHRYTIVYNGELYNTDELRKELEAQGIVFTTQCDTEVVLYSYIVFKEACANKLNGIFAFAIIDEQEKSVYLVRDRYGIKPFYYMQLGSTLLFASEMKALLEHPQVSATLTREGLWQLLYLTPINIIGKTVFKDIFEVPPAYHGFYKEQSLQLKPYWQLEATPFEDSREEAIEKTKQLLTDAITRQLVSDVPLCTFLSGGIDSSIISAVAAKQYKEKGWQLSTYSFEYEGNKENFKKTLFQPQPDDEYATYLAGYLGTNHKILMAGIEGIAGLLTDATAYRDLPGMADIDSSLLYYCSEVKENHTVALSGECADEIFGGYPWFYRKEMLAKEFFPWIHDATQRASLFKKELVKPQEGYQFAKEVYQKSLEGCPVLEEDTPEMRQSRYATWLSTRYFMVNLLERKDRMSMASGVEVRVPFADHRVLEYVYNVPWEIKFEGQVEKALLRNAMGEYLPDKILHRKKSPYPKTHHPKYETIVYQKLQTYLSDSNSALSALIDQTQLDQMIRKDNVTWFGQLMSKPQLFAWLIQLEEWIRMYQIKIEA